ncbi:YchJ family protein [Arenimonas sp.]|uniref:YchJ family protein n=1 Tax=Arenimonas sp. TaxID=1872635 RepID=UPI0035B47208
MPASPPEACPCGRGDYAHCCGPLHAGSPAPDAEALMRSRYSAYALHLADYLLATWHPSTRPATLAFDEQPPLCWLGLDVKRHAADGDRAVVEFVARYRQGGGSAGRMRETSRFLREGGRWYYVDGDVAG